ncbi:MAG: inactive transglutaminase family protein [Lysobacteraceae bacterium]|nr:inactive transglutaminase family protein [Xanthomonadaceae bacterium]HRX99201.1 inactive transglutaminase family protein [Xanthomonadaceae bacterium]
MKKTQLYILATVIAAVALSAMFYKWRVLNFPLQPVQGVEQWTLEARVEYQPRRGANTVSLQLPDAPPGFSVIRENFIAKNYSKLEESHRDGREVQWAIRRARGTQALYYRATVVRSNDHTELDLDPRVGQPPVLEEPYATAAQSLLEDVREGSADIATFAQELVRRFNAESPGEEVSLLRDQHPDAEGRARFIAELLAIRNIPSRVVHGMLLGKTSGDADMRPWLLVHNGTDWITIDLRTATDGWPSDLFLWSASRQPLLVVDGNEGAHVSFKQNLFMADAVEAAQDRLKVENPDLINYSLFSLPLQSQETYRILLMVPVGAFIMLLLRNLVGVSTFGTFMPVLVALAFRQTHLLAGVALFVLVVGMGLLVRFYLERLRLLLVPRLTAVLILVVLLMALVSVISNRLGIEVGLSVALFPMVIMAMTIERMSVAWEERGGGAAMREGTGTLVVAAFAHLVMSWTPLEHLVFVFPEVLLLLFAASLVIGRYSGYRLSELLRFRTLADEAEAEARRHGAPPLGDAVAEQTVADESEDLPRGDDR